MTTVSPLPRFFLLLVCVLRLAVAGQAQEGEATESIIDDLAFSSNGRLLAVGIHRQQKQQILAQELRLYDVATGRPRWTVTSKAQSSAQVAFSPDGTRVALAGQPQPGVVGQVAVWEVATHRPVMELTLDKQEQLTSLAFSPDGSALMLGTNLLKGKTQIGAVKQFDIDQGELQQTVLTLEATPRALTYSRDGKTLVGVMTLAHNLIDKGTEVIFWNTADYSIKQRISLGDVMVHRIAFTPDLKKAALTTNKLNTTEAALVLWDIETQNFVRIPLPSGEHAQVSSLHFTPDGKQLIVVETLPAQKRAQGRVFDAAKGELLRTLDLGSISGNGQALPVAFQPDGLAFAVAAETKIVELHNLEDGALMRFFE